MNQTTDGHNKNLIQRIMVATSNDEVKRLVESEMNAIISGKEGIPGMLQFADRIVEIINKLHPVHFGHEEWGNLKMARIHLNYLKFKMKTQLE